MAYHKNGTTVDGVRCEIMSHPRPGGSFHVAFEREFAGIEAIEKINWARPVWDGEISLVPVGYGFTVERIDYDHQLKLYNVQLKVQEQYWGDVTGYQAEIEALGQSLAVSQQERDEALDREEQARQETAGAREALESSVQALEAAYREGGNASEN